MTTLTRTARQDIRDAGMTVAGYTRLTWPDGVWRGDACGCTDDRCIGHHHNAHEDCGCLPAIVAVGYRDIAAGEKRAVRAVALRTDSEGRFLADQELQQAQRALGTPVRG